MATPLLGSDMEAQRDTKGGTLALGHQDRQLHAILSSFISSHNITRGVLRTLTPRRALDVVRGWSLDLDPGSGTRLSYHHTEEYGVVHGSSNHTRRIARGANNKK